MNYPCKLSHPNATLINFISPYCRQFVKPFIYKTKIKQL